MLKRGVQLEEGPQLCHVNHCPEEGTVGSGDNPRPDHRLSVEMVTGRKGRVRGCVSVPAARLGHLLFSDAASGSPIPAFRIDEVFLQISEHLSMNTGETQEQTLHKGEVRMSVNLL